MVDISRDVPRALFRDLAMNPRRKTTHVLRVAFVALAGTLLAAAGSGAVSVGTSAPGTMGKACCRVARRAACCCCETPATARPATPAASRIATRTVGVAAGCAPASCRCLAGEPADSSPISGTPRAPGRPISAAVPAFRGSAWDDIAGIRRAAILDTGSGPPRTSPRNLRTTPLLI